MPLFKMSDFSTPELITEGFLDHLSRIYLLTFEDDIDKLKGVCQGFAHYLIKL